jgi:hypothetical protein
MDATRYAPRTLLDDVRDSAVTVWHWVRSNVHNAYVTSRVLDFMYVHRLKAGRLAADHPWATGMSVEDGQPIWPRNILYASPRKDTWVGPEPRSRRARSAACLTRSTSSMARSSTTAAS